MRMLIGGVVAVALGSAATAQFAKKTADYEFHYTYPAAAARIVPLRA